MQTAPFTVSWQHNAPVVPAELPVTIETELPPPTYAQIKALEHALLTECEPVEEILEHHFMPGVYIRKLTLPKGTVLVGKIHSTEHACIVAKGRIMVASEQGRAELEAGDVFVSGPGAKRVGYALEETVFINIHTNPDNETDLAVLEAKFITPEVIGYDRREVLT